MLSTQLGALKLLRHFRAAVYYVLPQGERVLVGNSHTFLIMYKSTTENQKDRWALGARKNSREMYLGIVQGIYPRKKMNHYFIFTINRINRTLKTISIYENIHIDDEHGTFFTICLREYLASLLRV